jgi:hypothetical protein
MRFISCKDAGAEAEGWNGYKKICLFCADFLVSLTPALSKGEGAALLGRQEYVNTILL